MKSFSEFWPFYLAEHRNPVNRRLHFVGTLLIHIVAVAALLTGSVRLLISLPFIGYGFAWLGHLVFERNRPATFRHPLWSLLGDFKMFYLILFRRL